MFDNIAPKYDVLNRVLSLKIDKFWRKKLVKMMSLDKPEKVLDLATGTGDLAIEIAKHIDTNVIGADLSQNMLNVAGGKVKKHNLEHKIQLQKADAENLPFVDESFDAVSIAFGVRNFENVEAGLSEIKRVLKEGQNVYILEFSKVTGILGFFYGFYFKFILPTIGKLVSKDDRAYKYLPESVQAFPYGEKMKKILENVGFSRVEYKKLNFGIVTIYKAKK